MSRRYPGYYIADDMIRLYAGDEKKYKFPTNKNWKYQIALDITYVNNRGKTLRFGKGLGRSDSSLLVVSIQSSSFNYHKLKADAIITGFNYCAGDQYDREVGTNDYPEDKWKNWKVKKIHAVYLIIRRKLKEPTGIKVPRAAMSAPVLKPVKKVLTKSELEKKYPTPKKYLKAQKALRRKIAAQETRRIKRVKKQRALKRK